MLSTHAVRKGPSAAWLGLDWLGDSEVSQLVVLGADLYNGACGLALFLAAHGAVADDTSSKALAVAALARLRQTLRGRNPARAARVLGLGGGLGLGSIVYGLAVIAAFLDDDDLLVDAHTAAALITDEVISADRQLDVLGGSAGAILGLLRLYRQSGFRGCAEKRHQLRQASAGARPCRADRAPNMGGTRFRPSAQRHGARCCGLCVRVDCAGVRDRKSRNSRARPPNVLPSRIRRSMQRTADWADLRGGTSGTWPCKWCYGAPGIGLARAAMAKHAAADGERCRTDIRNALVGAERGWPGSDRHAVLRHAWQRRILVGGRRNAGTQRTSRHGIPAPARGRRNGAGRPATTGGAPAPAASISASFAASRVSATRRCGGSTTRCPTS